MAVKWNKIYRGGVHRTTPETRQVNAPATGTYLQCPIFYCILEAGGLDY